MFRLGIVDFDSSHCVEFTRRMNHVGVDAEQYVTGARVVLACPGSSQMAPERIPGHIPQVTECGVELVEKPADLIGKVDAILVLSICGAAHRAHAERFLDAGLPVFVDKPFACTLIDAQAMFARARSTGQLLWSSSGMRFANETREFAARQAIHGELHGLLVHGPAKRADGNPGLFHYGIHATEILCTLMGPGCRTVTTCHSPDADVVTLEWQDGRTASLRGIRKGSTAYGFVAFCENGVLPQAVSTRFSYRNLCQEIVRSLETRQAPVTPQMTMEVVAIIEAVARSEAAGGVRTEVEQPSA